MEWVGYLMFGGFIVAFFVFLAVLFGKLLGAKNTISIMAIIIFLVVYILAAAFFSDGGTVQLTYPGG